MVSEFTNRSKSVDEITVFGSPDIDKDEDNDNNEAPEVTDKESSESDLQEIREFLYENEDMGKKPLKKRPRMMEVPYSTGILMSYSLEEHIYICTIQAMPSTSPSTVWCSLARRSSGSSTICSGYRSTRT